MHLPGALCKEVCSSRGNCRPSLPAPGFVVNSPSASPSSPDPTQPGKLLEFQQGTTYRNKKPGLAADRRKNKRTMPAKAFRIQAGVPHGRTRAAARWRYAVGEGPWGLPPHPPSPHPWSQSPPRESIRMNGSSPLGEVCQNNSAAGYCLPDITVLCNPRITVSFSSLSLLESERISYTHSPNPSQTVYHPLPIEKFQDPFAMDQKGLAA